MPKLTARDLEAHPYSCNNDHNLFVIHTKIVENAKFNTKRLQLVIVHFCIVWNLDPDSYLLSSSVLDS